MSKPPSNPSSDAILAGHGASITSDQPDVDQFRSGEEHMPECPATTPPFTGSCTCPTFPEPADVPLPAAPDLQAIRPHVMEREGGKLLRIDHEPESRYWSCVACGCLIKQLKADPPPSHCEYVCRETVWEVSNGAEKGKRMCDCKWMDIESAPERRKVIVTWVNALGKRRTAMASYWPANTLEMADDVPDFQVNENGQNLDAGWWEESEGNDDAMYRLVEKIDFWMPLPLPPLAHQRRGDEDQA